MNNIGDESSANAEDILINHSALPSSHAENFGMTSESDNESSMADVVSFSFVQSCGSARSNGVPMIFGGSM